MLYRFLINYAHTRMQTFFWGRAYLTKFGTKMCFITISQVFDDISLFLATLGWARPYTGNIPIFE